MEAADDEETEARGADDDEETEATDALVTESASKIFKIY